MAGRKQKSVRSMRGSADIWQDIIDGMPVETARYNLNGCAVGSDYKGIVIIHNSDDPIRKII